MAPGSSTEIAALASVDEGGGAPEALDMVKRLVEGHETTIRTARELVDTAEQAGDVATADLATERIEIHEKTAWMLRSMAA
jgi:starvation-inducible DNA-binding protein